MRKRLSAMAIALAAGLGLAACGSSGHSGGGSGSSGSGGGGGSVTLKLVAADYGTGPSNTSSKYWGAIAKAFHKANPTISVKVTVVPWTNFDSEIQTMVQNHNYPDVTEGDYVSDSAQQGLLYPASQVMSNPGELLPVFKKQGTYKGVQYGIPFTTSSRTLFYNKKLFQQAGISSAPQTWNDIKTDALKIKALVQSGATEPNPGTKNRTDLWKQFAQNQIGMINGSPALIPIIQQGGVLKPSDWAQVPIAGKNGPLQTTLGVCDFTAAFKAGGTSKQAAIKKFLDFAYQDKYQLQFDKEYDLLPATTSATNKLKADPQFGKTFGSFLNLLPKATQYPNSTAWAAVKAQIQHIIGTAVTGDP